MSRVGTSNSMPASDACMQRAGPVNALQAATSAAASHQNYFVTNPEQPYYRVVIAPKVAKLRRPYLDNLSPA